MRNDAGEHSHELTAAIAAVEQDPKDPARWERVEELLEGAEQPEPVSELFQRVLGGLRAKAQIESIGQRGVAFYETWFGHDSAELIAWLERVRKSDPEAQWTFERLTIAYTAAERFRDLLDAYDEALRAVQDPQRRTRLLEEAAQVAKDFAEDPDRAIGYLLALHRLDPDNSALVSLERLLERRERWDALCEVWLARIGNAGKSAHEARIRLANCYLEKLNRPGEALEQLKQALAENPGYEPAFDAIERVLTSGATSVTDRREASALLKRRKLDQRKPHEVVRVLELSLSHAGDGELRGLLRELIDRLVDLGDEAAAMRHQATLLVLDPSARERDGLRALAQRTANHALHAKALRDAAEQCSDAAIACELRLEAGAILHEGVGDVAEAAAVYLKVFHDGVGDEVTLEAGRRLLPLLEKMGRDPELLDVLARMSELEREPRARRGLLGRMAKLAERLEKPARAEEAWHARLRDDAEDVEALEALIRRAADDQRWQRLAELLEQRIRAEGASAQRRQDMVWLASTYADRLNDNHAAIEVWRRIQTAFGEDPESISALTELLGRAERWQELAEVLSQAAAHQIGRFTELQTRLGDAYRERLAEPGLAAERYASALQVDPRLESARRGQHALVAEPVCRPRAIESLVDAYERTDEWQQTLGLLDDRLSIEPAEPARAALLMQAAELYERRANEPKAALACLRRAFPLAPDNRHIEREIRRLAQQLDSWDAVIATYRETIACFTQPTPRVAELRFDEGKTLEERLRHPKAALTAYAQAAELAPERVELAAAVVRVAGDLRDFPAVAQQIVRCAIASDNLSSELLEIAETTAAKGEAGADLAQAFSEAVGASNARGVIGRKLHARAAHWQKTLAANEDAAERELAAAVRAESTDLETLRALAALQRRSPGESLCQTLRAIAELTREDLDPLREAAAVAETSRLDDAIRCEFWQQLYDRSAELLRAGRTGAGASTALDCLRTALDHLVETLTRLGQHERAYALLVGSSGLPLDPALRRADLHRAARIAAGELKDEVRAITLYRDLLKADPRDLQVIGALSSLYQAGDQLPELLVLKRHELSLQSDPEVQLGLRLEIAGILGELEARGGRMQTLQDNLRARPGHAQTLKAISELLIGQGRRRELAELLREQARALLSGAERARAASLLQQTAELFEGDQLPAVAIDVYRELYELAPAPATSAALARLYRAQGSPAQAAKWLERRLSHLAKGERAETAIELAMTLLQAGEVARARHFLEQAMEEDPGKTDAREILCGMYRASGAFEPLAKLLAAAAHREEAPERKLSLLNESAAIYCDTLGAPERALDVLQQATALSNWDRDVAIRWGDALTDCGQLAKAREVFERLVEGFGRKRSPERAELHFRLAKVAKASGDVARAFEELEQATKMDPGQVGGLHMLAGLYQEQGDLDRAERAYRSLLMLVRRHKPGERQAIGQSEVFHALATIAETRGHQEQATEFLESAMEAAVQSDADAERFQGLLKTHGRSELLLKLLQARLKLATDPRTLTAVLTTQAELLSSLGRDAEAFDTLGLALGHTPDDAEAHRKMRALAVRLSAIDRYLGRVEALAEEARARGDEDGRAMYARLTLRVGEAVEQDVGDLERAAALYHLAETTGKCPWATFSAIARLSKTRGDFNEQRRALVQLCELPAAEAPSVEARRDARFALIELELGMDAWREAGVQGLEKALEDSADYERPKAVLRAAVGRMPDHVRLRSLFEQVARAAHDSAMLLEHFARRRMEPDVKWGELREGIELALRESAALEAEALLERAATLDEAELPARERSAVLRKLSAYRSARGDMKGAIHRLREALDCAVDDEVEDTCLALAELAARPEGDLEVAAAAYMRLIEAHPGEERFFLPAFAVLRALRDRRRFEDLAARCVSDLPNPEDRAKVNFALANFLIDVAGDEHAAISPLRAVLEDQPGHADATATLVQILERHHLDQELAELLQVQFDRARDEQDLAAIGRLALRMGALYGDAQPQAAIDVYRSALDWLPSDAALIEALLSRLGQGGDLRERAELMQRLLKLENGQRKVELALGVAPIWEELYESELAQEALELGHEVAPGHVEIRERLERFYTDRQMWQPLSRLLEQDAERATSQQEALERLKRAAALYRDPIGDLEAASTALRKALAIAPEDIGLLGEMARTLAASGQQETAIADIKQLLEAHPSQDPERAELLRVNAELRLAIEDLPGALRDLEEAYAIVKQAVAPALVDALERFKTFAFTSGDTEGERRAVMRLVELHEHAGDLMAAREALSGWVEQTPQDLDALRALLRRDQAANRWAEAADCCERLLEQEAPEARPATVLALAEAAAKAEQPERAREWLERVERENPKNDEVHARLRQLYEDTKAYGDLAGLLVGEADALSESAERVALYQRAARLFLQVGDPSAALPPLNQASALAPEDQQTQLLIIDLSIQLGTLDEADQALERAIAAQRRGRSPELAALYQRKARLSAARGQPEEQLKWLNQASDIDRKSSEIASELADAAMAEGNYDVAMKALRALTMMDDPKPITRAIAFLRQAQIAKLRGDPRRAQHWARKAKSLDASLGEVDALLAELEGVVA